MTTDAKELLRLIHGEDDQPTPSKSIAELREARRDAAWAFIQKTAEFEAVASIARIVEAANAEWVERQRQLDGERDPRSDKKLIVLVRVHEMDRWKEVALDIARLGGGQRCRIHCDASRRPPQGYNPAPNNRVIEEGQWVMGGYTDRRFCYYLPGGC